MRLWGFLFCFLIAIVLETTKGNRHLFNVMFCSPLRECHILNIDITLLILLSLMDAHNTQCTNDRRISSLSIPNDCLIISGTKPTQNKSHVTCTVIQEPLIFIWGIWKLFGFKTLSLLSRGIWAFNKGLNPLKSRCSYSDIRFNTLIIAQYNMWQRSPPHTQIPIVGWLYCKKMHLLNAHTHTHTDHPSYG